MDLNSQLQPIIAGIINDVKVQINQELRQQLSTEIIKKITSTELTSIINDMIRNQVSARLDKFDFVGTGEQELRIAFKQITDNVSKNLVAFTNKQISSWVDNKLNQIDIQESLKIVVQTAIGENLKGTTFPDNSISHRSINFSNLILSGDHIKGGIIEQFGSIGIEDLATHVQVTVMDHAVAFENSIHSPEIKIAGDLHIGGKIQAFGKFDIATPGVKDLINNTAQAVRDILDQDLFEGFNYSVFDKIKTEGIDLDKITQNGKEVVLGNRLGFHITESNLQKLGIVKDLQTTGESLLCETLYTTGKRVGINTLEPSSTLSIWDQEVEISVNKYSQDTGYIGTARNQKLVIGANNKQNITLMPDGTVSVQQLDIGSVKMSTANKIPSYESFQGHIVWNSAPSLGENIGWVCIGGARWAKFGKIE